MFRITTHTHTHTHIHWVSLICAAASQESCYWKARTSTTQRGASGRTRWLYWESYWSACSWPTYSCDESTAGNDPWPSVYVSINYKLHFYLIYLTGLKWDTHHLVWRKKIITAESWSSTGLATLHQDFWLDFPNWRCILTFQSFFIFYRQWALFRFYLTGPVTDLGTQLDKRNSAEELNIQKKECCHKTLYLLGLG